MWKTRCRRCKTVHMVTSRCPSCESARAKAEIATDIVDSGIAEEKTEE